MDSALPSSHDGYPLEPKNGLNGVKPPVEFGERSLMVMALCGNAFMPVIYGLIADNYNLRTGYIVLIPCFLYLIFYAFYGYKLNYWSELWKIRKTKK